MSPLYHPSVNYLLRTALKPFARLIPPAYHFPVTGTIEVRLPEGKRIRLACNPTSYLTKVLFWRGFEGFEHNLGRLFIDLVKQSATLLDVGANIGYYSVLAAAYNPSMQIVSFEPLPSAYRYLETNIRLNDAHRVIPAQVALSDAPGQAQFFVTKNPKFLDIEDHIAGTSGFNEELAAYASLTERIEVRTETMDRYVAEHLDGRVDLIKLDTEASEHLVLAGAQTILAEHRPIVLCEVLPGKIEDELQAIFRRHGYRMYRAVERRLVPTEHLAHGAQTTNDHVMVHPDALHKVRAYLEA